jgi:GntR family transcriptional regulator
MNKKPGEPRLQLYISVNDPKPMYAQVESQLRDLILAGKLKPETKLPTAGALARDLNCSVITTSRVYKDLERDGFVRTRSGRGTVVVEISKEKVAAYLREPFEEAVRETVRTERQAGLTEDEMIRFLEETLQKEGVSDRGGPPRKQPVKATGDQMCRIEGTQVGLPSVQQPQWWVQATQGQSVLWPASGATTIV